MKPLFSIGALAALLVLLACGLVGCGSGTSGSSATGSSRTTGSARITINWPVATKKAGAPSRFIPLNALSVRITISGLSPVNQNPITWAVVYSDRPADNTNSSNSSKTLTTIENIDYLPVGPLNVTVDAFSVNSTTVKAGGTPAPTVIATGTTGTTIIADQVVQLPITLGSTINTIVISPVDPNVNLSNPLAPADTIQLMATAYDGSTPPALVPLPAPSSPLLWASLNTDVLQFNPTTGFDPTTGYATFTANNFGTAVVTVLDQGSKVSGKTNIKVQGNIGIVAVSSTAPYNPVTLTPINLYGSQDFAATLTGTTNLRVTWDIIDPATGTPITNGTAGTLTLLNNDGVNPSRVRYSPPISPRLPGTYTIRATAQAFPDQSTTKTITVLAGYGVITITNG